MRHKNHPPQKKQALELQNFFVPISRENSPSLHPRGSALQHWRDRPRWVFGKDKMEQKNVLMDLPDVRGRTRLSLLPGELSGKSRTSGRRHARWRHGKERRTRADGRPHAGVCKATRAGIRHGGGEAKPRRSAEEVKRKRRNGNVSTRWAEPPPEA